MPQPRPPAAPGIFAEADAWATVLVRFGLLHTATALPTGQWFVQHRPDTPVRVLAGPQAVLELVAAIQRRTYAPERPIR
ncbi:hypothetical protein ADK70_38565 [Streptomyces rimosus subsp. pseudoverticillatus]|uniref:hypothetical protein n=1 Tax=Streptomyces rimosus TaxID=1927 RepID=UPI0006B2620B|nr:hypothetical protein [Streptomyces rimosus]KOT76380.1 hypothetical protein ADK70_38565 [Streptomyces rimosus subsp. pseudoverticillatus]